MSDMSKIADRLAHAAVLLACAVERPVAPPPLRSAG